MSSRLLFRLPFFVLLLIMSIECPAQHYLQLTKRANGRTRIFQQGNRVRYQVRNAPGATIRGRIQAVTDTGLWVNDRHIRIDSLRYIGAGGIGMRVAAGAASTLIGLYLITHIGPGNQYGVVQYVVGQVFTGLGVLEMVINGVRFFTTTRYDLERKWSPRIRKFRTDPGGGG
jgi:hypothetical protein